MSITRIPLPPGADVIDIQFYNEMLDAIDKAIEETNGISIVRAAPDKPREGKIYYLLEDLDDDTVEGYYVHINGVWSKLTLTPATIIRGRPLSV